MSLRIDACSSKTFNRITSELATEWKSKNEESSIESVKDIEVSFH